MIARNCTVPHKFICVTDEKIDGIDCIPMDWSKHVPGTIFARLAQHGPLGHKLGSRVLSLDLDIVITGNIDHIVSRPEPRVWWKNPNWPAPQRSFYQSSVQLFTPGTTTFLYDDFDPEQTPRWVNWRYGGKEQAWLAERMDWNEATFDERDGIYGAGRLGGKGVYSDLPENAALVSFPGARIPSQPEVQEKHPWIAKHYY